jgi:hypothetical protein
MKTLRILCVIILLLSSMAGSGQKAVPMQITSFLTRLPLPESSQTSYASCTKSQDPSNGSISVTGAGPSFNSITDELNRIMQGDMAAAQNQSMQTPNAPSPDQVAQMQQQAAQMQNMSPQQIMDMQKKNYNGQNSQTNTALMRKIGEAQSHLGPIQQLNNELRMKLMALDKSAIDKVKIGAPCSDVKGTGDIAVPTCGCMIGRASSYEKLRVMAFDDYLQNVRSLLKDYIPKFNNEIAVIDKVEADAKYGEGISDPATRQQLYLLQRQGLSVVPGIISIARGTSEDGAKYYANLINAQSGSSVGCYGRK